MLQYVLLVDWELDANLSGYQPAKMESQEDNVEFQEATFQTHASKNPFWPLKNTLQKRRTSCKIVSVDDCIFPIRRRKKKIQWIPTCLFT